MTTREQLFTYLKNLGISTTTFSHEPVFTCEEAMRIKNTLPTHGPIKNLFLKDKYKKYWLIVALHTTQIHLKSLAQTLNAPDLRFARPEELLAILGVTPGSVTPFALLNDIEHKVSVIIDATVMNHNPIGVHPLLNDATTLLTPDDLATFVRSCGHTMQIIPCSPKENV